MPGVSKEWLLIAVFFVTFFIFTFVEAKWLTGRGKVAFGRTFVGSLLTNIIALTFGYGFAAVLLLILLALAWGGSLETVFGNGAGL